MKSNEAKSSLRPFSLVAYSIPHKAQRYDTCGDWQGDRPGQITVRVSDMFDWRHCFLVALHELVEAALCQSRGISSADVDAFDKAYEATRVPDNHSEPGDDHNAPYHLEHGFASLIERAVATELGVDWTAYERAIEELTR